MSTILKKWCGYIPDELVDAFQSVHLPAIFVGAGFGKEALPAMQTGGELARQMRTLLGVSDETIALPELLQYYKNDQSNSPRAVRAWLEQQLGGRGSGLTFEPGGAHHLLLQLPSEQIFTTNFDDLLDRAAVHALPSGFWSSTADIDQFEMSLSAAPPGAKTCAHIHGRFYVSANKNPFVAATDDYISIYSQPSSWLGVIAERLRKRRFIFIGYSMRDFTTWTSYFSTILTHRNDAWPHAMVSPSKCRHEALFWYKYGIQFIPLRAYQFLIALAERLGKLNESKIAINAAAACWGITPEDAKPRFERLHRELKKPDVYYTVRDIITETNSPTV